MGFPPRSSLTFFEALSDSSIFSILSSSFCLLLAWLALLALARFFSTKRSSCALRSALASLCGRVAPREAFLGHVLAVVAGITVETAIFELQDRTGDGVEEVAVVGDDEDGAPRPLDEVLQPLYGAQVEVVGRLVEEDEIGSSISRRARAMRLCSPPENEPTGRFQSSGRSEVMVEAPARGTRSRRPARTRSEACHNAP